MGHNPAQLLRQHGIQVTAQRLAVLRAVADRPHITADGVVAAVRQDIGAISLQSVYDALSILSLEGLIRRIQPAGSPARFEDRVGDNHHHLVCRACGRMVDVACAVGAAPCLSASDDRGYEIDEAEVVYWGRCPDCVAKAGSRPTRATRKPGTAGAQARGAAHAAPAPRTTNTRITRSHATRRQHADKRGPRR